MISLEDVAGRRYAPGDKHEAAGTASAFGKPGRVPPALFLFFAETYAASFAVAKHWDDLGPERCNALQLIEYALTGRQPVPVWRDADFAAMDAFLGAPKGYSSDYLEGYAYEAVQDPERETLIATPAFLDGFTAAVSLEAGILGCKGSPTLLRQYALVRNIIEINHARSLPTQQRPDDPRAAETDGEARRAG